MRTSAQFDELPTHKLWSIVLIPPQIEIARKTEAMDTASPKPEGAGKGAVGGDQHADPDKYPMSWMRDHQRWYDDEMIEFWPLLCPPHHDPPHPYMTHSPHHNSVAGTLSSVDLALVIGDPSHLLPPAPTNMEIRQWLSLD